MDAVDKKISNEMQEATSVVMFHEEKKEQQEPEGKKEKQKIVGLFELFKFADNVDVVLLVLGTISGIASGAALPLFAVVLGGMYNDFSSPYPEDIEQAGDKYASIFGWIALGVAFAGFGQIAFFTIAAERQTLRIRKLYLNSILKQEIGWFDNSGTGELASKISENTVIIRDGIGDKLGVMFQNLAMFFAGIVVGFIYSWKLTLVILAASPLLMVGGFTMMKFMQEATSEGLGAYAEAGAIAEEAFSMIRTVAAFSLEGRVAKRFKNKLIKAEEQGCKKSKGQGFGMGFTMGVYFLCYALAFWYGATMVLDSREEAASMYKPNATLTSPLCQTGTWIGPNNNTIGCISLDPNLVFQLETDVDVCNCISCNCGCQQSTSCVDGGDITLVFFSVVIGAFAIGQAAPGITALTNARAAAANIFEVLDRKPLIDESSDEGLKMDAIKGEITFKNVSFKYPSREMQVFDNLNLTIEAGQTVALVGASGCGKSTITQLFQRFYDPDEGEILLDGKNLKDLNLAWFRSNLGLVGQEPVLFATSIRQNIAYGGSPLAPEPTMEQIEQATRNANAYDFISDLPEKFETFVGERGSTLSGGQKQRIAIARALVRNPSVLILDEATSALDNESERIVQQALDKLLAESNRTTIVIAHRLSTVRNADKIVVLGNKSVLEQGTHDELLNMEGHYSALVAAAERSQKDDIEQVEDEIVAGARKGSSSNLRNGSKISQSGDKGNEDEPEDDDEEDDRDPVAVSSRLESGQVQASNDVVVTQKKKWCCGNGKKNTAEKSKKEKKEELYTVPMSRLLAFSTPERKLYFPAFLAAAVNGLTMPLFALLFASISTVYFLPTQQMIRDDANQYALYFLIFSIVVGVAQFFQMWLFGIIGEKMTTRVRHQLFLALLRQEIGYFDQKRNSVGAVTSRLASDAAVVKAAFTDKLSLIVMNSVTIVSGLVIAFTYGWELTLILFALLPLLIISGVVQMLLMAGMAKEDDKALSDASQVLSESINGIRTVTAFQLRKKVVALYDSYLEAPQKLGTQKGVNAGLGFAFSQAVMFGVYSIAFYAGSRLMTKENDPYTFEDVIGVFFAIVMMGMGVGQTAAMAPDVGKASAGISNVFRVIDRKSDIDPFSTDGAHEGTNKDIVFKGVQFSYPTRKDIKVFEDFNLKIESGKTVAFVGQSGSGKSTSISLIERFYDPNGGSLQFFGVDSKSTNVRWMRSQIGLVQQEPQLFNTTIFENIAYGVPQSLSEEETDIQPLVTEEMVIEAAKAANAHDFIMGFPDGYQTQVGQGGSQLSGGQKQRICLSRTLIRKPEVLLLDEATSALDNESERVVQESLDNLMKEQKRTTIVVAHRLSTIQNADMIVVCDHGKIIEKGTHQELLALNGAYAKLYESQAKHK